VTVVLRDDGGTLDGGIDASAPQTFTIAVTTFIEEAGTYNGLVRATAGATTDAGHFGLGKITVTAKGRFSGTMQVGARRYVLSGTVDKSGAMTFTSSKSTSLPLARTGLSALALTLQLDVGAGTDKLSGVLTENGQPFAALEADRALYSAARVLPKGFQRVPETLLGGYTVAFAAPSLADPADSSAMRGCGVGTVTVSKLGTARLTGTLADGTPIVYSNALSKANAWPLFVPLAGGRGSMSGWVSFPQLSDDALQSPGLLWFKPAATGRVATLYASGWPGGMDLDLMGSKYVKPARVENRSTFAGLGATDAAGNADAELLGSGLPAGGLHIPLNILANDLAQPIAPNSDHVALRLVSSNGTFSGSFTPAAGGGRSTFKGVILQKQQCAVGYFLRNGASGSIEVVPKSATP
jgi:hypothetical protein